MLAAAKRVRHAWLRRKFTGRPRAWFLQARQILFYRVPGELEVCPACAAPTVEAIEPLAMSRHGLPSWRFGFIAGCRQCGVLFANPLPSAHELEAAYAPEGEWGRSRQHEQEAPVSRARLERIFAPIAGALDVLHPPPGAAVLDFGCGLGGLLDTLADAGWTTHGVDPATKVAFRRHREVVRVPETPAFDLVVLHHVLEHVTAPLGILRQLAAATRPGGFLLVSVPNLDTLQSHGELEYCIRAHTHVLAYSSVCLRWLTSTAGFQVVGEARDEGTRARQRVIVARRQDGALARPSRPLEAATTALRAYLTTHPQAHPHRWLPVRCRAALANRRRLRGREPR